jgi:predicted flap endonuclease-1-like 5' DNA nuclease
MRKVENVNAPNLWGWAIGVAAGLVAFGVLVVVGKFNLFPAAFLGGGIAVVAGLVLGMPWGAGSAPPGPAPRVRKIVPATMTPEAAPARRVAEAVAQPVVQPSVPPVAEPAAFVAAPPVAEPVPKAARPKAGTKPKAEPKAKTGPKPKAEPKAKTGPKPKAAKPAGPQRLAGPRGGRADDLKEIEGIGPAMEKLVNSLGFYHFDQIASWSDADVALVDAEMKTFKGRISRDRWVAQAKLIVSEGLEAFRERAKTNNY